MLRSGHADSEQLMAALERRAVRGSARQSRHVGCE